MLQCNLISFEGDVCRVGVRPKSPQVFTGWVGSVRVCRSTYDDTVIATGTVTVAPTLIDVLIDLAPVLPCSTVRDIQGDVQALNGDSSPFIWYLTLKPPGGDTSTYAWGYLFYVGRGI